MNWWCTPCSSYSSPSIQMHSTQPRTRVSIQAACSPQPRHPVLATWTCTVPVISASKSSPEGRSWNKTPWVLLHKGRRSSCPLLQKDRDNFFFILSFCFLKLLSSSRRSKEERFRSTETGISFLPAFRNTTTHQKGTHGNNKHTHSSTLASHLQPRHLVSQYPLMSPLPQPNPRPPH